MPLNRKLPTHSICRPIHIYIYIVHSTICKYVCHTSSIHNLYMEALSIQLARQRKSRRWKLTEQWFFTQAAYILRALLQFRAPSAEICMHMCVCVCMFLIYFPIFFFPIVAANMLKQHFPVKILLCNIKNNNKIIIITISKTWPAKCGRCLSLKDSARQLQHN